MFTFVKYVQFFHSKCNYTNRKIYFGLLIANCVNLNECHNKFDETLHLIQKAIKCFVVNIEVIINFVFANINFEIFHYILINKI